MGLCQKNNQITSNHCQPNSTKATQTEREPSFFQQNPVPAATYSSQNRVTTKFYDTWNVQPHLVVSLRCILPQHQPRTTVWSVRSDVQQIRRRQKRVLWHLHCNWWEHDNKELTICTLVFWCISSPLPASVRARTGKNQSCCLRPSVLRSMFVSIEVVWELGYYLWWTLLFRNIF